VLFLMFSLQVFLSFLILRLPFPRSLSLTEDPDQKGAQALSIAATYYTDGFLVRSAPLTVLCPSGISLKKNSKPHDDVAFLILPSVTSFGT
jgi:hypothetical protein